MKRSTERLALFAGMALAPVIAFAGEGSSGRGGGDLCQNRIEEIRNDIAQWISAGSSPVRLDRAGSAQLDFNGTLVSLQVYNQRMLNVIGLTRQDGQTSISCTTNPKEVHVDGKDKVCVAYYEGNRPRILCYRGQTRGGAYVDGFLGASQDEQYFQVHHELAVLAGLEDRNSDETNYPFSRQISGLLEDQVVRKLAIKKAVAKAVPEESVPSLYRTVRDVWRAMQDNKILIPHSIQAGITGRSDFGIFEVKMRTQALMDSNSRRGEEQYEFLPIWLSVAFDPLHPGNLAYARLRGAMYAGQWKWAGGGAEGRMFGGGGTLSFAGKERSRAASGTFFGGEVHQYLDVSSDGQVQLYLRGAGNLSMSEATIRTIDLNDDKDALVVGEIGILLLKKLMLRGKAQVTGFVRMGGDIKDNPALHGFAPAYGAGVDWQVRKNIKLSGNFIYVDTSKLENNDGKKSVVGANAGVTVEFW